MAAPNQGPPAIVVDDHWAPSGYWPNGQGIAENTAGCPMRAGQARGKCHQFNYTSGQVSAAGIFWQSPSNNWGDKPGYDMPSGYVQVRFYAWGAAGGEVLGIQSGLNPTVDGYTSTIKKVTLTTTPKEIVIGIDGAYRSQLVSAFEFGVAGGNATFYIDDIVIVGRDDETATPSPIASSFVPSGYFADQNIGFPKDAPGDCDGKSGVDCHHFSWDRGDNDAGTPLGGYAGVAWVPAAGSGVTVDNSFREVSFTAWSKNGGDLLTFIAGGSDQPFDNELAVKLPTTPTHYSIGVGGSFINPVHNGFVWVATSNGGDTNPTGVNFFLSDIQWR